MKLSRYQTDLEAARELTAQHRHDDAYIICDRWLKENPNDPKFLTLMGYIMLEAEKLPIAYSIFKRCIELAPTEPGCYLNLGQACNDLWRDAEAMRAYKKGLKYARSDEQKKMISINLASLLIDTGRFEEAERHCHDVLKIDPDSAKGRANLGFSQLAQRNWQDGWKNYHYCIGHHWRPRANYVNEPEWDQSQKGTIVVYAEQGIGDVVSGASMVPDMLSWCGENQSRLVLDVDARLAGLFQRSFPEASVYGTRGQKELTWNKRDVDIAASIPIMQLGEFFRNKDEDFPGTPYLKPDPDRALQWKALFESKKKPVIGLAWRGGIPKTGAKFRQLDLEQLLPILESVDAHWVSLQYKPAGKEIVAFKEKHPHIDIVEYPHGTLTNDYDDTAALVSALDHVMIMQTAVGHLAGSLGVPCWTLVPKNSQWRYGSEGEDFLWAKSVRLIRQKKHGEWQDVIRKTAGELSALFRGVSKGAGKAARKGKLRRNGAKVRPARKRNNGQAGDQPSA